MTHPFNHELLDSLAAHEEFVRRLANRLADGMQTAEDVAQDVWLAAASASQETRPADTRGFLAGIVRHVVLKKRRGEVRRAQRQRLASRPEGTEATDNLVAAEEWRRKIINCVLQLPELEREVILQRFFDGSAPRQIAARLNLPVETVKSRLKRALARLRRDLENGGDANELLHGLTLAATAPGVAGKAGLLYKLGAYGMKTATHWKVAALFGLFVASLLVVQIVGREPNDEYALESHSSLTETSSSTARPDHSNTRTEDRLDAVVSNANLEPNSALAPSLHGVLRTRSGASALEEVSLQLEFASGASELLTTSAEGEFEFTAEGRRRLVAISISATSLSAASRKPVHLNLDPSVSRELTLTVGDGAVLSGIVLDRQDQPVAGALVRAWCAATKTSPGKRAGDREVRTNAQGEFTLEHLGEWIQVEASSAAVSPTTSIRGFVSDSDYLNGLILRVASNAQHQVRVVSETGEPVLGATVELSTRASRSGELTRWEELYIVASLDASHQVLTNSEGLCVFDALPIGESIATVRATGFLPWKGSALVEREANETRVVLQRGFGFSGRVVSPRGDPIPGARVRLRAYGYVGDRDHDLCTASITDAEGRYAFESVPPGRSPWISVEARGYSIIPRRSPPLGHEEIRGHVVQLEDELRIRGHLVDVTGEPISGIRVALAGTRPFDEESADFGASPKWKELLKSSETRTGPNGDFEFEGVPAGMFRLTARWFESTERAQFFEVTAGSESLELVLTPEVFDDVTFTGRVLDAHTGEPIQRFSIVVIGQGEQYREYNSRRFHFDVADGRFAIGGSPPIESSLFVAAHGYRDKAEAIRPRAPGEHVEEVRLQPVRSLSLRFVDQHGTPVAGNLMVRDSLGRQTWIPTGMSATAAGQTVGEDGLAILQNLPAERILLLFFPTRTRPASGASPPAVKFEIDLLNPSSGVRELQIDLPE